MTPQAEPSPAKQRTKHSKPDSTQKRGPTESMIKFAQLVAAGMNKTDAYRQSHPKCKGNAASVQVKGCNLAKHKLVAPLIIDLMERARDKAATQISYGLKEAMEEANEAYQMAKTKGLPTAMYGAVFLKARLLGLLAEERKNDRTPLSEMTDDQLKKQIEEAATQAGYEFAQKLTAEAIATASAPAAAAPLPKIDASAGFKIV